MTNAPRRGWVSPALCALLLLSSAPVSAQEAAPDSCPTIKAIEVRGNSRMSSDAVRFDLQVKVGQPWDETAINREFARFWRRGLFSDLRFSRRCEPDGAVLVIDLKERARLVSITYEKNKEITQQQIEDHFKQREFSLSSGTPVDRKKLWRAENLIKEALAQKGFMDAQVRTEMKDLAAGSQSVTFRIKPGGKTRVRKLDFVGNAAFSDGKLRDQLKLIRSHRWYWPWDSKSLYHPLKYQQDINNVVQYYKDHGYLDADTRPPVVDVRADDPEKAERKAVEKATKEAKKRARELEKQAKKSGADPKVVAAAQDAAPPEPEPRTKKWVYLTVPVDEGPIYKLGSVRFEGNTVFPADTLRAFVPIREGQVLADNALEAGIKGIQAVYGTKGYIYAAVTRRFERREGKEPVADIVVQIEEDQPYTVRRIEFRGNTTTKDEVLRRELNVVEGELLNKAQLDRSIQKLQNLGFWLPGEEASLQPVAGKAEVDVAISGEEQSRNEVQIGGGYSELEGGFFMGSYQTRNFLGRGESLDLSAAVGGRSNRASIGFTEPWFLDKPYTFGFSIYRRTYDFGRTSLGGVTQNLTQSGTGGSITLGRRIGDFSIIQLSYGYESVDADTIDLSSSFASTRTKIASLTPFFSYRRVNNPLRPTRGLEVSLIPQVAARVLGGDNTYFKPRVEGTVYLPTVGKLFLAVHTELAYVRPFGKQGGRISGVVDSVPRFERFFLGGDTSGPRVFETRTISPIRYLAQVDSNGNAQLDGLGNPIVQQVYVGGNKSVLAQFELGYPIGKTATIAGFFDAGSAFDNGEKIKVNDLRMSAGLEFRVYLPVFQAPIRLIYGWPIKSQPNDATSRFQFSIGLPF